LQNDAGAGFTDVSAQSGALTLAGATFQAQWVDHDLDGDVDVSLCGGGLFENVGGGVFSETTGGMADAVGQAWGDFNGDFRPDRFEANESQSDATPGDTVVASNEESGGWVLADVTDAIGLPTVHSMTGAFVDYDNDGDLDLHSAGGLYRNDDGSLTDVTTDTGLGKCKFSCLWFDFDEDGALDVFVAGINANQLFRGVAAQHQLLAVRLDGIGMNRFGVGARVIVTTADGQQQHKQMVTGTGRGDSAPPVLYFGLGVHDEAQSVRVMWPNGVQDEVYGVAGGKSITLAQGANQDTMAPAAITNLAIANKDQSSVTLGWTAPGDDGQTHQAHQYQVRYYPAPINQDNWDTTFTVSSPVSPGPPGTWQLQTIKGLEKNKLYYFAVRTLDEMGNVSAVSNTPSDKIQFGTAVFDLDVGNATKSSLSLTWTAPDVTDGDYKLVVSKTPLSEAAWDAANAVVIAVPLGIRGDPKSHTVEGLAAGTTYHFGLRIQQPDGSLTPMNNAASGATQIAAFNQLAYTATAPVDFPNADTDPMSGVGDINKDGFDDFVVVHSSPGGNLVHIHHGSASPDFVQDHVLGEPGNQYAERNQPAGDLNGDGYHELAVSDFNADQGKVFLNWGGPTLSGSKDLTLAGITSGDRFGRLLGGVQDINQDGLGELFVIASQAHAGYLYLGQGGESLSATPDTTLTWPTTGKSLYTWESGDFNGDDHPDIVVAEQKTLFVFSGTAKSIQTTPSQTITLPGSVGYHSGAGDVNGDGVDDLVLGTSSAGQVWVYWGGDAFGGAPTILSADLQQYGDTVAVADLNGDGSDDVLVSNETAHGDAGVLHTYLGGADFDTQLDVELVGPDPIYQGFGRGIAAAGDVNGDGFEDVLVRYYARVVLVFGNGDLVARTEASPPSAPASLLIDDKAYDEVVLAWVAPGDDGDDGTALLYDLRFRSPELTPSSWHQSQRVTDEPSPLPPGHVQTHTLTHAQLVPGLKLAFGLEAADEWLNLSPLSNVVEGILATSKGVSVQKTLTPDNPSPNIRAAVGNIDLNGDQQTDFVFGDEHDDTVKTDGGKLYFYFGTGDSLQLTGPLSDIGDSDYAGLGSEIVSGDFNGDKADDIAAVHGLEVRIYWGGVGFDPNHDVEIELPTGSGPIRLAAADLNGDNKTDVIARTGPNLSGSVYVFFGGAGFGGPADLEIPGQSGEQPPSTGGIAVGDFNQDNYADLVVTWDTPGEAFTGQIVSVYFGGDSPDGSSDLTIHTPHGFSTNFGDALANVGDVNGDGNDDLLIGDDSALGSFAGSGGAYLYLGHVAFDDQWDLHFAPPFYVVKDFADSIHGIGDVNGDGFDDLMVVGDDYATGWETGLVYFGGDPMDTTIDRVVPGDSKDYIGHAGDVGDLDGDGRAETYVAEGGDSATFFSVDVDEPTQPQAIAGPTQYVTPGAEVALNGSGIPVEGDIVSHHWLQISGAKVELSAATAPAPTFAAPGADGMLEFRLVVRDAAHPSPPETVAVHVLADDGDGILLGDNCPNTANVDQLDTDADGLGDVCDDDLDGDDVPNDIDVFPADPTEWSDTDADEVGDNADVCPDIADPEQGDLYGDSLGDACDTDADGDGFLTTEAGGSDCHDLDPTLYPSAPGVCDDGDACTVDTCAVGVGCEWSAAVCDDADACTSDGCDSGSGCIHDAVVCDDGVGCTADSCDASSGCEYTANDSVCDDLDVCNGLETCDSEADCTAGMTLVCDDGMQCNGQETCEPVGGCLPGTPPNCDDGNPCTTDACDAEAGCVALNNGDPCDDDSACTTDDACEGGSCAGQPVAGCCLVAAQCDDANECTVDLCVGNVCVVSPKPPGAVCDDGDVCTVSDSCQGTACGGKKVDLCCHVDSECDDLNACTDDTCAGILCNFAPNSAACDDGDPCTAGDTCSAGSCAGGAAPGCCTADSECDDGNPCTIGSCADNACLYASVAGCCATDADCDDTNACTSDLCADNTCTHSDVAGCCAVGSDCEDGQACVESVCVAAQCATCSSGAACGAGFHCVTLGGQDRCLSECVAGACDDIGYDCLKLAGTQSVCLPLTGDCECLPGDTWTCSGVQRVLLDTCEQPISATAQACEYGCDGGQCCPQGGCDAPLGDEDTGDPDVRDPVTVTHDLDTPPIGPAAPSTKATRPTGGGCTTSPMTPPPGGGWVLFLFLGIGLGLVHRRTLRTLASAAQRP